MSKYLTLLAGVVLFSLPNNLWAVTWSTNNHVTSVQPEASGDIILYFANGLHSNCTVVGSTAGYISVGQAGVTAMAREALLSTALVALTTNRTVHVKFDETVGHCWITSLQLI